MSKKILGFCASVVFITGLIFLFASCSSNASNDQDNNENRPVIIGCNTISYLGITWRVDGCQGGNIASFDETTTQQGKTASWHITCLNGCIKSVTLK